jgi:hypothetical protein
VNGVNPLFLAPDCGTIGSDNAAGAQTERRGGAGPVGGLLGGKDPTGRFRSQFSVRPSSLALIAIWMSRDDNEE